MTGPSNFNKQIIEEFRANEGRVGGPFQGATMLLLHSKGAKSGEERINPLVYYKEGDMLYVFGSKGGHPKHPDWYFNLVANPDAKIEVGTETWAVRAEEVTGADRDRIYEANAKLRPAFAQYQSNTSRKIPVIGLHRRG